MPIELRRIIFSDAEIIHALRDFCGKTGRNFPRAEKLTVMWQELPEIKIMIRSINDHDHAWDYDEPEIAGALILWCHDHYVPLPQAAQKHLRLHHGKVCLDLSVDPEKVHVAHC